MKVYIFHDFFNGFRITTIFKNKGSVTLGCHKTFVRNSKAVRNSAAASSQTSSSICPVSRYFHFFLEFEPQVSRKADQRRFHALTPWKNEVLINSEIQMSCCNCMIVAKQQNIMFLFFLKRVPFSYKYWIRLQWYRVAIIEWLNISLPLYTFLSVRCSYGGLLQLQALIAGRKTILAAFLQFVADVQASCEVFNIFWAGHRMVLTSAVLSSQRSFNIS